MQGRSHAFKTGGAQAAKIILGPFYLKKWRSPTLLLLCSEPKTRGVQDLLAHSKTTLLLENQIIEIPGWWMIFNHSLKTQLQI